MKKESASLFSNLFGAKGKTSPHQTSVMLTSYSQPNGLREKMEEELMTHGETVTANISPVRLERSFTKAILYFCPLRKIEVLNTIAAGDGGFLPSNATIEGLAVPDDYKPGLYRICNVEITSNGTMQVKATAETHWEKVEA
ncbi:MAG: hypothetical protein ACXVBJ_16075 [Flavisolibacter sp.]